MRPILHRCAFGVLLLCALILCALTAAPMPPPAFAGTALLVGTSRQTADAELRATVGKYPASLGGVG